VGDAAAAGYHGRVDVIGSRLPDGDLVVREIGRGARAHVYLVSDGQRVRALKLLPRGDEARARHELDIAGGFRHPHVNPVDAVVEVVGRPGVLMPLVPGRRLQARSRSERGRSAYLDAFDGLLQGLAYLHGEGVMHRDLKPENVLVDALGTARLIDFDLAARVQDRTRPGLVGTIAYLSPEQARGDPSLPASDVYAAGVMLFGALTGEVPFTGTVAEVVTQHREAPVATPSSFDPALSPFDALLSRMLAKQARDRLPDGAAALSAFRRVRGVLPRVPDAARREAGRMPT
jgi:eukaryotic-like serine/threonine-protein kinase